MFSGIIIFNFGAQESLRTFLNPFFTGRAVEGSAALAQQAALQMPFSSTTPLVKMRLERSAERDKREIINILSAEYVQSAAEHILNRLPRQPAQLLHGKAGLQGAVDAARQQRRAVGNDAVQRAGRDHKVCALLRLHQGGDARRHHRHA